MAEERPLNRWSRLKAETRTRGREAVVCEAEPSAPDLPAEMPAELAPEAEAEEADLAAMAEEHGLPAVDTLTVDSDFTQFMADGVPELLRKAALRKLWRSSPVFAVLDGPNDYDEDFNVIDTLLEVADSVAPSTARTDDPLDAVEDMDDDEPDGEEIVSEDAEQVPRRNDTNAAPVETAESPPRVDKTPADGRRDVSHDAQPAPPGRPRNPKIPGVSGDRSG